MRFLWLALGAIAFVSLVSALTTSESSFDTWQKLQNDYAKTARDGLSKDRRGSRCNWKNVAVRKEWGRLSNPERTEYVTAVLCLQAKPPLTLPSLVPGVRSHFDDFVAAHINQTLTIHFSGKFLPWHRYFTWAYEQALREECGYTGHQPYWDWPKYAQDPAKSPLFDGGPYSLSGNGKAIPHGNYTTLAAFGNFTLTIPPGNGGGCIQSGPFANMTIHLGPVGTLLNNIRNPLAFAYRPRCLIRDFRPYVTAAQLTAKIVSDLILRSPDMLKFQTTVETLNNVHSGGHRGIGGDMADLYSSPNDPAFYFHHAMIDRVWTIWQARDQTVRSREAVLTNTFQNTPPSKNTTLDDYIDLGVTGEARQIRALMSTTEGPFCYIYE